MKDSSEAFGSSNINNFKQITTTTTTLVLEWRIYLKLLALQILITISKHKQKPPQKNNRKWKNDLNQFSLE